MKGFNHCMHVFSGTVLHEKLTVRWKKWRAGKVMANHLVSTLQSSQGPAFRQRIQSINQFKLFLFFPLTIVVFSNSQLPWWCAIPVWIPCLHFCFSHFFFHFFNFSILSLNTDVFIRPTRSVYLEWGNQCEPSPGITLHFASVSVICIKVE